MGDNDDCICGDIWCEREKIAKRWTLWSGFFYICAFAGYCTAMKRMAVQT
jgi:hypothetical protein